MIFYLTEWDDDRRILAGSDIEEFAPGGIPIEVPDNFFEHVSSDYIWDGDASVTYSPKPPTEEQIKAEQVATFVENGPSQMSDIDDVICGLYETNLYLEDQIQQLKGES